jgi:hypothetical protein
MLNKIIMSKMTDKLTERKQRKDSTDVEQDIR